MTIPSGFEPLPTSSPFNNSVGPIYCRAEQNSLVVGLAVETRHCNTAGLLHGAMCSALFDVALGNNIALAMSAGLAAEDALEKRRQGAARVPIATVSLSIDFAGTAREGDWVEVHAQVQKVGGTLAYANGLLRNGEARIGQASGVYRILGTRPD